MPRSLLSTVAILALTAGLGACASQRFDGPVRGRAAPGPQAALEPVIPAIPSGPVTSAPLAPPPGATAAPVDAPPPVGADVAVAPATPVIAPEPPPSIAPSLPRRSSPAAAPPWSAVGRPRTPRVRAARSPSPAPRPSTSTRPVPRAARTRISPRSPLGTTETARSTSISPAAPSPRACARAGCPRWRALEVGCLARDGALRRLPHGLIRRPSRKVLAEKLDPVTELSRRW